MVLLGVVEPPNVQAAGEGLPVKDPRLRRRELEAQFENTLRVGDTLGIKMSLQIRNGDPADEICRAAHEVAADLIILGQKKQTWADKLFNGSVSERVLRNSGHTVLATT